MSGSNEKEQTRSATLLVWGGTLWLLAIWTRLEYFPFVQVTSDTLSPFVGAIRWWNTGWFGAANPESDQWLWIISAPLFIPSESLSDLFWWKCIATTVVIPCTCWLVMRLVDKQQWFWMLVAASILMLDMGLVDTMLSSFRGYWAPECMAVATMGLICLATGKKMGGSGNHCGDHRRHGSASAGSWNVTGSSLALVHSISAV